MKGDICIVYNLERGGWYGARGEIVVDIGDAFLYKYSVACALVEMANEECGPLSPPVALMCRA